MGNRSWYIIKEVFSIIISVMGIVFVLFLTYYSTKWLSIKSTNMSKSKYINVIDKMVLGQNKYLAIVEISNKYYLLSITDNNINIIKELDELDELEIKTKENAIEKFEFNKVFSKFMKK